MIKLMPIVLGLTLALEMIPPARAQVTIDVAKITCEQYNGFAVADLQNIAIWLSGYYHGKRGDTTLDPQGFRAQATKVRDFCFRNPQTFVMDAVEKLFETTR